MGRFGVELLLILFCSFMTVGIIITYIVAVKENHVNPGLPYISNTGSYPPESCIFSFVLSCVGMMAFMILWIRYCHIKAHYADSPAKVQVLNSISLFFGFLCVLGLVLVGSFQDVNVIAIHIIGAFMVFICGAIYSLLQTCLTYRLQRTHPQHVGCCTLTFRIIFCLLLFLFVPLTIIFSILASQHRPLAGHRLYAGPTDVWYILHIIGASSEWLVVIVMVLFFLTFHPDFTRISVDLHVKIRHHHNDVEEPMINEYSPLTL